MNTNIMFEPEEPITVTRYELADDSLEWIGPLESKAFEGLFRYEFIFLQDAPERNEDVVEVLRSIIDRFPPSSWVAAWGTPSMNLVRTKNVDQAKQLLNKAVDQVDRLKRDAGWQVVSTTQWSAGPIYIGVLPVNVADKGGFGPANDQSNALYPVQRTLLVLGMLPQIAELEEFELTDVLLRQFEPGPIKLSVHLLTKLLSEGMGLITSGIETHDRFYLSAIVPFRIDCCP